MSRTTILTGLALLGVALGVGRPATAHTIPATRSVVVQVEDRAAVLLVGFEPAVGDRLAVVVADALAAPRDRPDAIADALRARLVAGALAPIDVTIDGHAVALSHLDARVTLEPGRARPSILVLIELALPERAHHLAVTVDRTARFETRLSWLPRGCRAIAAPTGRPARRFDPALRPLELELGALTAPRNAPCELVP